MKLDVCLNHDEPKEEKVVEKLVYMSTPVSLQRFAETSYNCRNGGYVKFNYRFSLN